MRRYARWGGRRVKSRTGSRPQLLQAAQPHHQRRYAARMGLPPILRAHRAVGRVDRLCHSCGTGTIGRRGTPASSLNVIVDEDFGHQQCCRDECKQPGQREHLRATRRQVAAVSSQESLTVRIRGRLRTCSHKPAVAVDVVGAEKFRWWSCSPGPCASGEPLCSISRRRRGELRGIDGSDAREVCQSSLTKTA